MAKSKNTKHALVMSLVSLLLCATMLIGTTFAWFTDSVSSARNTIQSGNLDVELYYSVLDENGNWTDYAKVTKDTEIFDYELWEPGYTSVAKFKIVNEGSLALKYQLTAEVYSEVIGKTVSGSDIKLSDHILYGVTEDIALLEDRDTAAAAATTSFNSFELKSASLAKEESAEIGMVLAMPTTVGNEANHDGANIPSISFGINLLATQDTVEADSFDKFYDKDADYGVTVTDEESLRNALKTGGKVILGDDITISEKVTSSAVCLLVEDDVVLDLNGHTVSSPDVVFYVLEGGNLIINGDGEVVCGVEGSAGPNIAVYAYKGNVTINGGTYSSVATYPDAPANHGADLIYTYGGGKIDIYGGYFKYTENVWTLNENDANRGTIKVYGGTFERFNPADNISEGANTNFVANRYTSVENNGVYTVTPITKTVNSIAELKTAIEEGDAAVIDANGKNLGDFNNDIDFKDGVTLKNAEFSYFYGGKAEGTVVFENCEFISDHSYSAHFDDGDGRLIFNNCVFDGWNSFGAAIENVEMNNCTFKKTYNYGILRFYQNAQINNCTFEEEFEGIDSGEGSGHTIELNGCTGISGKIYNNSKGSTVYKANWFVNGVELTDVPVW